MTAAALTRAGFGRVLLLEQEAIPGFHASGRNAAIARRLAEHPAVIAMAARSLVLMGDLCASDGRPVLRRTGGVLLGHRETLDALVRAIPRSEPHTDALLADIRRVSRADLELGAPWLARDCDDVALVTSQCGVVDIHALLQTALAAIPGSVRLRATVTAVERAKGAVAGVVLGDGTRVATPVVVNAAGSGLNALAALAGAKAVPIRPVRRHLLTTAPHESLGANAPWFWHVDDGWYLRREGRGLLLCACDATPWAEGAPMDPPRDPAIREIAAQRFTEAVPGLAQIQLVRDWAGLRVLTPDSAFVIGPDPEVEGFWWVGGLGGHGMTTSLSIGEFASACIMGQAVSPMLAKAFSPARFDAQT